MYQRNVKQFNSAYWVILLALNFYRLLFFFKLTLEKIFREYHQRVKQFGSRSGPTFSRPDLGTNCLQKLSADDTNWQS